MGVEVPIRRVRFSTESYLRMIWRVLQYLKLSDSREMIVGGLMGKRTENMVYVSSAVACTSASDKKTTPLELLIQYINGNIKRGDGGMEVVGWYASSPGMDLSCTGEIRRCDQQWQSSFPGTFVLLMDTGKIEANEQITDYLKIFVLSGGGSSHSGIYSEVSNIDVELRLPDIIRTIKGMTRIREIDETGSGKTALQGEKKPVKAIRTKRRSKREVSSDPIEELDRLSQEILTLKGYLAKLKRENDRHEHEDRTWSTKRIKFLKLKQLSLLDSINLQIQKTSDIQMRIAFYKIRDSLSKDMKLLDDLINKEYMHTLTDLVKMGAEKPEG